VPDSTWRAGAGTSVARDQRTMNLAYESETPPADLVREHLADQLAPLTRMRDDLARVLRPGIDLAVARERLAAGQTAYDPMEAVGSAGNLLVPFVQATVAIERAGLATLKEATQARDRREQVLPLVASWLAAEPAPRDRVRAAARRAAAVVANAVLRATSAAVLAGQPRPQGTRVACPCCGCAPDFTRHEDGRRIFTCARCDAAWESAYAGCLGCGATLPPALAFVESPLLGYRLVLCNPCGRYLKEPLGPTGSDVTIERALTAQLDAAAETRGLRL
jgi:hypothetical protein